MGRFAPTPSGDLHLGSLYAAAASYLDARAHGGRWLLRIEDLDRLREVKGAADQILRTLEAFGFQWDGPVCRQSGRTELYEHALASLRQRDLLFGCACSRAQLEDEPRYPGTCRDLKLDPAENRATRIRIDDERIEFCDRVQGIFAQQLVRDVGDFVVKRRDQLFAYVLAVVVDDAEQGITHVVRGADLLDNTPRQIFLQDQLAMPRLHYAHVPVLCEPDGTKLAKSARSVRIQAASPLNELMSVFDLLGMPALRVGDFADVNAAWRAGIAAWQLQKVPKCLNLQLSG
ncbi:MAG TPA: tRNA glutamyl-Q(34) synthetase GluQRS [Steroidobacteraceae bacterium]